MPLGNLTSQFFANVYLNELDQFVKHVLKAKYYLRYVDDFVILHNSKGQLKEWKSTINNFLNETLKLELHQNKSKIINVRDGINFLGFRIFYYHKLLKKSNLKNFERKFNQLKIRFKEGIINREKVIKSLEGWLVYASHADTFKFRKYLIKNFNKSFPIFLKIKNYKKYNNFVKKIKESELQFSSQKTLFLFNKGFSIKEIAEKRVIKESTVWSHLDNAIKHNQLPVCKVLSKDKIREILYTIYSKKDTMKTIKRRLKNKAITFDEVSCVLASVKRKRF